MTAEATKPRLRKCTTQCPECGVPYKRSQDDPEHVCAAEDLAAMRRALLEADVADGRRALLEPLPDKLVQMTAALSSRLDLVILEADLPRGPRRLLRLILRTLDWRTLVNYRNPAWLFDEERADVGDRRGRMYLARFAGVGILRRSAERSGKKSDVPHLHYDPHDERLRGPTADRPKGSAEWQEGVRWLEWVSMSESALRDALRRLEALREWGGGSDPKGSEGVRSNDRRGSDQTIGGGPITEDRTDSDPKDPPFHRPAAERDLEHPPLTLVPHASLKPLFSSCSSHEGDLPESETATPGDAGAPSAPRLSSQIETRAVKDEREKIEPTRTPLPNATWDRLKEIVVAAIATKLTPISGPGDLLGLFHNMHREGWGLDELAEWVEGVAKGSGDADAARTNATECVFAYASKNPSLYAHEGRAIVAEKQPPAPAPVRERLNAITSGMIAAPPRAPRWSQDDLESAAARARREFDAFIAAQDEAEAKEPTP
jgi:hypothetical protein